MSQPNIGSDGRVAAYWDGRSVRGQSGKHCDIANRGDGCEVEAKCRDQKERVKLS